MVSAAIDLEDYKLFRDFLEKSCGIVLGDRKQYLVASRLTPVMVEHGLPNLGALLDRLGRQGAGPLRAKVIEAMTTNETQFFRDNYPFTLLREHIFPELQRNGTRQPRIWSAACSSGQEPYSISMTAHAYNLGGGYVDPEILGTDISGAMIREAERARYGPSSIARGLSTELRDRYFIKHPDDSWEVRPEIRRRVSFRVHNLLESYAMLGRFDVIFCRNVLIYFSPESRQDIVTRMAQIMKPGGFLVVGASESLARQADKFEMLRVPEGVLYRVRK